MTTVVEALSAADAVEGAARLTGVTLVGREPFPDASWVNYVVTNIAVATGFVGVEIPVLA